MGVTVFYRGRIDDLERIEDFEDRVLDVALEIGSAAQVWRSVSRDDPNRVVRGLIVNLAPGQETTSLLISPEGWLIPLMQIEDAENAPFEEPPWCWVKTQFGPVEGHVALVELLRALKSEFISNLEVNDEGGYWETRDIAALERNIGFVQAAIDGLADALRQDRLSPEAAEDPQILATRIERIARQVHQTLLRPAEHPPVMFEDGPDGEDGEESDAHWDAAFKEQRRKQERLGRALEERLVRGEDHAEAFENVLRDEGIVDLPDAAALGDVDAEPEFDEPPFDALDVEDELEDDDEPWRESLPESLREDDEDFDFQRPARHPLQERAFQLLHRLHEISKGLDRSRSQLDILHRGAGEMMGGLAQALGDHPAEPIDGWGRVQLRRALRGAAFARGALFALRAEGVFDDEVFAELRATVEQMQADILSQLNPSRDGSS
jgi:hypothetical protein